MTASVTTFCTGFLQASSAVLGEADHFPKAHSNALAGGIRREDLGHQTDLRLPTSNFQERSIAERGYWPQCIGMLGLPLTA